MLETKTLDLEQALGYAGKLLSESVEGQKSGLTTEQRTYYQTHPLEFSRDVLGSNLWEGQVEIAQALVDSPRVAVRSSHGIGKTFGAANAILWFISCFPPCSVITTAPTQRQVKDILWREVASQYHKAKIPIGGRLLTTQLEMSRKQKWFALGFTTDEYDLDRFQGFHNESILVAVDEACGVSSNIYSAIEGLLSAGNPRFLQIGNPTNENTEFGKSFKSSLYYKVHISAFDTPNFTQFGITQEDIRNGTWEEKTKGSLPCPYLVTPLWVAERHREWGEDSPLYQVRVLGNFPTEGEDVLISLYLLEESQALDIQPEGMKVLGVDIARFGTDESVATLRHGGVIRDISNWSFADTMATTGRIVDLIKEHQPDKVNIDVIGIGAGVVDRLKEQGYNVNGVNVGSRSNDPDKYSNVRAELFWKLRDEIRTRRLKLPDNSILIGELANFKYEYMSSGALKLEPKEKTKARLGKSPDYSDSLALTMYEKETGMIVEALPDMENAIKTMRREQQSDIMPTIPQFDVAVYMRDKMEYNKEEDSSDRIRNVCPSCHNTQGVVRGAEFSRCIICNERW